MVADFLEAFDSIRLRPTISSGLVATRVAGLSFVWVCKDDQGLPVVVVESRQDGATPPAVVLKNLRFEPWIRCDVQVGGQRRSRSISASLIRLTAADREMDAYFLQSMASLLGRLPKAPPLSELAVAVNGLIEIFQALSNPPETSIKGLWAELLLIVNAAEPMSVLRAWQRTRRSLFDFSSGRQAVEVKSSSSGIRRHHFKLQQLMPQDDQTIVVVSMLLTEARDGVTVLDLWNRLSGAVHGNSEILRRVSTTIAYAVGTDWRESTKMRFDERAAVQSVAVYDVRSIPHVGDDAPPEVSEIEFVADLSTCVPQIPRDFSRLGGLFQALWV